MGTILQLVAMEDVEILHPLEYSVETRDFNLVRLHLESSTVKNVVLLPVFRDEHWILAVCFPVENTCFFICSLPSIEPSVIDEGLQL